MQFVRLRNCEEAVPAGLQDAEEFLDGNPRVRQMFEDLRAENAIHTLVLQRNRFCGAYDIGFPARIAVEGPIRFHMLEERVVPLAATAANIE